MLFLVLCVLLWVCSAFFIYQHHVTTIKEMNLQQDYAVASALLEQGLSPDQIAAAVTGTSISSPGRELIRKIGITEDTALRFLPITHRASTSLIHTLALQTLLLSALLLTGGLFFLRRREKLYLLAVEKVTRFMDGDFSSHLPRTDEGSLYRLFALVDSLANALRAKNETEHEARSFLKDTISDISHQLKTPLAALNMYNEIIADEPDNHLTVAEFSQKTGQALKRIESLIGAMLKIARLDTGSILFEKRPHPVTELVSRAAEDLKIRAEQEDKVICVCGPPEIVECDLEWTCEAISNLIKNALDHTGAKGRIHITWERSHTMLRLFVSDNGTGINPEDFHHIFKRFYRSKNSLDTQGAGLGLPLAKSIIEGQGGLISVQSTPGEGTVFTLSFLTEL
nr:HAMP domain-containing sensor histidine kinase [Anaerovorax odorimutans]